MMVLVDNRRIGESSWGIDIGEPKYSESLLPGGALVALDDCVFSNNSAPQAGGAVAWLWEDRSWENQLPPGYQQVHAVRDCAFTDNTALYGGAVSASRLQGALLL